MSQRRFSLGSALAVTVALLVGAGTAGAGATPPPDAASAANTIPTPDIGAPWGTETNRFLPAAFQGPLPVVLNKFASQRAGLADKDATPPGANYYDPALALRHPYPVLLVHGTAENSSSSWIALAPLLRNAGFNVFTFNYGRESLQATYGGTTSIADSARALAVAVDDVLAITGAPKVDLVGHSQGGMMPHWYIRTMGGANYVHHMVGIAASNSGTTTAWMSTLAGMGNGPAMKDQTVGSPFMKRLHAIGLNDPRVRYTMLGSRYDTTVVPHSSNYLTPATNVTNIVIQDKYPTDFADHFALPYDPFMLAEVVRALDPQLAWTMPLGIVFPYVGGYLPLNIIIATT